MKIPARVLKPVLALSFGTFAAGLLLLAAEGFFRLNRAFRLIDPIDVSRSVRADTVAPPGVDLDLSWVAQLEPREGSIDLHGGGEHKVEFWAPDWNGSWQHPRAPRLDGTVNNRMVMSRSGRVVYQASYSFDKYGRRISQPRGLREGARHSFLLYGCSFTYGEGVDDRDTFAWRLADRLPDYEVVNFASLGSSPSRILADLLSPDDVRGQGVSVRGALGIYVFIDDHIKRVVGAMQWIGQPAGAYHEYFELIDGAPVLLGTFRSGRFWTTAVYKALSTSEMLRFFAVDVPRLSDGHFRLFARLIERIREVSAARYGVRQFVFVVFPGESAYIARLRPELEAVGIRVLDYSAISPSAILRGHHTAGVGDGHPSRWSHRLFAELLLADLRKIGLVQ